jgi:FkbM family methyltransferase
MNHFFDIGTNTGQTFDDFLCKTNDFDDCKIWCFEPSPRHLGALLKKVEEQRTRFKIAVCPFGFFGKAGTHKFYEKTDGRGDSFCETLTMGYGIVPNADNGYEIVAASQVLSEFIIQHTLPEDRITLKIDCEGGEFSILRDLLAHPDALHRCIKIYVEWHMTEPNDEAHRLTDALAVAGHPIEQWEWWV